MKPHLRSLVTAVFVLGLFMQLDCSGSSNTAQATTPEGGTVAPNDDAGATTGTMACTSDKQCSANGQLCDQNRHLCVECIDDSSCKSPDTCDMGHCVKVETCQNSLDCSGGHVCDKSNNRCVECLTDSDCTSTQACASNVCSTKCTSDKDCRAENLLCDTAQGHCAECVMDADCKDKSGSCNMSKCVPYACQPNSVTCLGGGQSTCTARGDGFGLIAVCGADNPCQPGIGCGAGAEAGDFDVQPAPIDASSPDTGVVTMESGLVMHWTLDEMSGSTASDSSGNGHTGTLQGLANWGTGKLNGAATFNGTSSFISTTGPVVDTSQPYTVAAWAFLDVLPNAYKTVASIEGASASGFVLQLRQDIGTFAFASQSVDGVSAAILAGALAPPVAQVWYHLAGVYDGASLTLYVNGTFQSSISRPGAWMAAGDTIVGRAKYSGLPTDFWPGRIDDVRFYSRALSADEVAKLANP